MTCAEPCGLVELDTILLTEGVACGARRQGQVNQARIAIGGARGTRTLCWVDGCCVPWPCCLRALVASLLHVWGTGRDGAARARGYGIYSWTPLVRAHLSRDTPQVRGC